MKQHRVHGHIYIMWVNVKAANTSNFPTTWSKTFYTIFQYAPVSNMGRRPAILTRFLVVFLSLSMQIPE